MDIRRGIPWIGAEFGCPDLKMWDDSKGCRCRHKGVSAHGFDIATALKESSVLTTWFGIGLSSDLTFAGGRDGRIRIPAATGRLFKKGFQIPFTRGFACGTSRILMWYHQVAWMCGWLTRVIWMQIKSLNDEGVDHSILREHAHDILISLARHYVPRMWAKEAWSRLTLILEWFDLNERMHRPPFENTKLDCHNGIGVPVCGAGTAHVPKIRSPIQCLLWYKRKKLNCRRSSW
jgi:hypothetical protein